MSQSRAASLGPFSFTSCCSASWTIVLFAALHTASLPALILPSLLLAGPTLLLAALLLRLRECTAPAHPVPPPTPRDLEGLRLQANALLAATPPGSLALVLIEPLRLHAIDASCGPVAVHAALEATTRYIENGPDNPAVYRIEPYCFAVLADRSTGPNATPFLDHLRPFTTSLAPCGHAHEIGLTYGIASAQEPDTFDALLARAHSRLEGRKRRLLTCPASHTIPLAPPISLASRRRR